ncbi:MAG: CAP domain-containing protein [Planctomycetia bacterium]|nr:CAP domain-containing protein [Planctomycetia bacterium]
MNRFFLCITLCVTGILISKMAFHSGLWSDPPFSVKLYAEEIITESGQKHQKKKTKSQNYSGKVSSEEKRESPNIIIALKKEQDDEKKIEMLQTVKDIKTVEQILKSMKKETQCALKSYQNSFSQAAKKAVSQRIKERKNNSLKNKIDVVKNLQKSDFTKEDVQTKIQPVVDEMLEMCWVDPETLVAENEKVAEDRKNFLKKMRFHDACVEVYNELISSDSEMKKKQTTEEILKLIEFDLILSALPVSAQGKKILKVNQNLSLTIDFQEALCISYINRYRILLEREPFLVDLGLCAVARDHSHDMATEGFFSHTSPIKGKSSFTDRAKRMGVKGANSENIYMGSSEGKSSACGWFYSPGHHKNMMNSAKRVGVGRFGVHYTMMTGG